MAAVVRFVGGPFDGHEQTISINPERLAETVALPVSEYIFELLAHRTGGDPRETSIALYELGDPELTHGLVYHFIGATAAVKQRQ